MWLAQTGCFSRADFTSPQESCSKEEVSFQVVIWRFYDECTCFLLHPSPNLHLLSVCRALAMVIVAQLLIGVVFLVS